MVGVQGALASPLLCKRCGMSPALFLFHANGVNMLGSLSANTFHVLNPTLQSWAAYIISVLLRKCARTHCV